eukprot:gene16797-19159_t
MKFGNRLEVEAVAEWASKYIDYAFLKKLIQKIPDSELRDLNQLKEQTDPESNIPSTLSAEEKDFLSNLAFELRKVEVFYAEQLKDAKRRTDLLVKQLDKLKEEKLGGGERRLSFFQKSLSFLDLNSPAQGSKARDDLALLENQIPATHGGSPDRVLPRKRVYSWSEGGVEIKQTDQNFIETIASPKSCETVTPFKQPSNRLPSERQSLLPKHNAGEKTPELSFRKSIFKDQLMKSSSALSGQPLVRRSLSQISRTTVLATNNIRKALIELYRSLELLKGYRDLNILAYIKIVKKFEKNTARGLKESLLNEFMLTPFYTSTE